MILVGILLLGAPLHAGVAATKIDVVPGRWSLATAVHAVAAKTNLLPPETMARLSSESPFWGRVLLDGSGRPWDFFHVDSEAEREQFSSNGDPYKRAPADEILRMSITRLRATSERAVANLSQGEAHSRPELPAEVIEAVDLAPLLSTEARLKLEGYLQVHGDVAVRALENSRRNAAAITAADVQPETVIEQLIRNCWRPRHRDRYQYNEIIGNRRYVLDETVPSSARLLAIRSEDSLGALIADQARRHQTVRVADVGGGYGQALWKSGPPTQPGDVHLVRPLIDPLDWQTLVPRAISMAKPDAPHNRFQLRLGDASTIRFPQDELQHLILMVESIWYAPDKLAAIANLYNQLADDGILVIATHFPWSRDLRAGADDLSLFYGFLERLASSKIEFLPLASWHGINSLWIQKKPGTRLSVLARLVEPFVEMWGTTVSFYDESSLTQRPILVHENP